MGFGWGRSKVFALIPKTPGAHSICVHCAAKDGFCIGKKMFCFFLVSVSLSFGERGRGWLFLRILQ